MSDEIQESINRIDQTLFKMWQIARLDNETMWEIKDVALYLNVSETQVRTWAKTVSSFPDAIQVEDDNGNQSHPKYAPEEIKAWIRQDMFRVSRAS